MLTFEEVKAKIHSVPPSAQREIMKLIPIAFPDILDKPKPLDPMWTRANYPLGTFVREAWPHVEPETFTDGWHIDAIADHLQAVTESGAGNESSPYVKIRNLCINIPPRTSKSLLAAVFWPAWVWIEWPGARFLFTSYSGDLSVRDAVRCRQLMMSDWYQERWGDQWRLTTDQNIKSYYTNSRHGYRISTSVSGKATGFGGDFLIGDDLHETTEDLSVTRAEIETAKGHWLTAIPSRVTDPKRSCKVLIGQRVAADDVSQAVLDLDLEDEYRYVHLNIPMEYDAKKHGATALWSDPRTEDGETLCPDRFPAGYIAEQKSALGHRYFAQYQQEPAAESASIFPHTWWKYYHVMPDLDWFDVLIQSWDFRFGDKKDEGSFVAGHLWARKGPPATGHVYLLDRYFQRASFTQSADAIKEMSAKWPGAYAKLIENKANGPAIYDHLRAKVFGLQLVEVGGKQGSKRARAEAGAIIAKEGRAWLPSAELCPWVKDYVKYMQRFPAEPDDDTDATSQAWRVLCPPKPAKNKAQEERERKEKLMQQVRDRIRASRAFSRTGV